MALKFLNKKGWHTGSLRNIENVWKAEQKHEAEQKKLEELKKQIQDEREQHEFRQLQEQAGLVPKQERLEFLYDSGLAVGKGNSEGFTTLGKPGESQQKSETQSDIDKLSSAPGALFVEEKPQSANDTWRKLHSDPLLMIRQREQAALAQIKNNPVKMEMIKKSMEEKRQRKDEKARRKAEKKKRHKEKKRRRSPSTDTDTCDEKRKRKRMKHATSCDSDSDGSAGNSCDENKKNSRDCYIEPKLEKCYDRTKSDNLKVQGLNSDMGHNRADFKYGKKAIEKHRDWRYDDIPTGARIPQPSFRERQRSPTHHRERQILPSHHRERHRTSLHDRERSRSPSDFGERHREKYSLNHSHSYPRSRYLDSNERDGDRNGLHRQSTVNGSRNTLDECSDGPLVPEKLVAAPDISSKPAPRGKYQAVKLSEEEKAARLREMQIDAELHDEQRWQRLKRASDADALEAKQSNANSGKNFLDATNRSVYGAEKGGSSTIEESVRRRTHYLQSSASARDGNAFRR